MSQSQEGQLDLLPQGTELAISPGLRSRGNGVSSGVSSTDWMSRRSLRQRDRITVDLRGLRSRVEARAAQDQVTTAALARRALSLLLDGGQTEHAAAASAGKRPVGQVVKVTLRLSNSHATSLAARARAADVAQGTYICALLDGVPPSPLPADHSVAVAELRASTDRVAAMSVDLNAFLRLLGRVPASELESYRAGLVSLASDMRVHLAKAAALIAELTPSRSARR